MTSVAVLGTGGMGTAIVRSLLRTGLPVHAWNRTASRAASLADEGAVVFDDARDAVRGVDVVISIVFDTQALLDVLDQIGDALDANAVVMQSVTVGARVTDVIKAADRLGITWVDAPVLGNPPAAEAGKLSILVAGNPELRPRIAPVLDAIAGKVTWVDDHPGAANMLKLVCNAWVQGLTVLSAQSFAFAKAFGVDPRQFVNAMSGSVAASPYLDYKAAAMLEETDEVVAQLDQVDEVSLLIRDAARAHGASTVLHDTVRDLFRTATDMGYGKRDAGLVVKAFELT